MIQFVYGKKEINRVELLKEKTTNNIIDRLAPEKRGRAVQKGKG